MIAIGMSALVLGFFEHCLSLADMRRSFGARQPRSVPGWSPSWSRCWDFWPRWWCRSVSEHRAHSW
jgi:hypothetical protein